MRCTPHASIRRDESMPPTSSTREDHHHDDPADADPPPPAGGCFRVPRRGRARPDSMPQTLARGRKGRRGRPRTAGQKLDTSTPRPKLTRMNWKKLPRWLVVGLFVGLGVGRRRSASCCRGSSSSRPSRRSPPTGRRPRPRCGRATARCSARSRSERRIPLTAEQIPKVFRDAVIAVGGRQLLQAHRRRPPGHRARGAPQRLSTGASSQGASTITQQLARTLFLHPREDARTARSRRCCSPSRSSSASPRTRSSRCYANQVNFGHGNYGVEAASRFFFGKPARAAHARRRPRCSPACRSARRPVADRRTRSARSARRNHVLDAHARGEDDRRARRTRRPHEAPLGVDAALRPQRHRGVLHRGGAPLGRGPLRHASRCSRAASRSRPRSTRSCRRSPRTRCARGSSSCSAASAGRARAATSLAEGGRTSPPGATPAGRSCEWQQGRAGLRGGHRGRSAEVASLRIGGAPATLPGRGRQVDRPHQPHPARCKRGDVLLVRLWRMPADAATPVAG